MTTVRDLFDQSKLTLHRLNTLWSPTGKTFCYSADHWIRQSVWNDRYPNGAVMNLHYAMIHLLRSYKAWNREGMMDRNVQEWNSILASAMNTLETLRGDMNRVDVARIETMLKQL